jgi:Mg-chelatase subunit ChlD
MAFGLTRLGILASAALLVAAAAAACTAGNDAGSGGSSSSSGTGANASSGTAGNGTGGSGGSGGDILLVGGQGQGGQEECLATQAEAERKTLDMLVVLDRSGSMSGTQWSGAVTALTAFFNDPSSEGIWAGINFFPTTANECEYSSYSPPQVQLGLLPDYASTLIDTMSTTVASGGNTPTPAALYGSLQYATAVQDQNPEHVVVAVLATDGSPNACSPYDIATIAGYAQAAYNYNGVKTYVIAISGAVVNNLNQIAAAGGTVAALDVTNDISQFLQKMEEIRADALGCEYTIPDPSEGEFEATKLNVQYTAGGSNTPTDIPQADNAGDCSGQPGWYYDDNVNPTKVLFCPVTCNEIQSDSEAKVDFLFGCATVVN